MGGGVSNFPFLTSLNDSISIGLQVKIMGFPTHQRYYHYVVCDSSFLPHYYFNLI